MTPPTTVDPALTPEAVRNFQIASWIAVAGFVVVALVVWVLFVRPIVRLFVAVVRLFVPRHRYRRPRHRWVAPLRLPVSYSEYIHSAQWRAVCDQYWRSHGRRCQYPGCTFRTHLQIHHLSYIHFGHEQQGELLGLCVGHHDELHARFNIHITHEDPGVLGAQIRYLQEVERRLTRRSA